MNPVALVVLTFQDATGSSATTRHYCPSTIAPAAALTAGQALGERIAALGGTTFVRVAVSYITRITLTEEPGPAGQTAALLWSTPSVDQFSIVTLPDIKPALVDLDGQVAGPTVDDLVEALLAGPWCNPFGYALFKLEAAYVQDRD